MNFFGMTALQMFCSSRPHLAMSEPLCGVPRNRIP